MAVNSEYGNRKDTLLHFYKSVIVFCICVFFRQKKQQFEKEQWEHVGWWNWFSSFGVSVVTVSFVLSNRAVACSWKRLWYLMVSMKSLRRRTTGRYKVLSNFISWVWTDWRPNAGLFLQNPIGFVITRPATLFHWSIQPWFKFMEVLATTSDFSRPLSWISRQGSDI